MVQTNENKVVKFDLAGSGTVADPPSLISFLLERTVLLLLNMATFNCVSRQGLNKKLTEMKREMHFATFFASLARVMGPGGLLKSFVGICLLHCL